MTPRALRDKLRRLNVPVPNELEHQVSIQLRNSRRKMMEARHAKARAERRMQAEELAAKVSLAIEAGMGTSHSVRLRRSLSQAMTLALRKWMKR